MKYFIDTEFHEYKKQQKVLGFNIGKAIDTIDLISIGIVSEDGDKYYAISKEFDVDDAWSNAWLRENVLKGIFIELNSQMGTYYKTHHYYLTDTFCLKHLKRLIRWCGKSRGEIREEIMQFVYKNNHISVSSGALRTNTTHEPIEFYAYYADYDWVVFCWIFGRMIDLPKGFPMYCNDLKQSLDEVVNELDWSLKKDINNKKLNSVHYHNDSLFKGIDRYADFQEKLDKVKSFKEYPTQGDNEHNALADAQWNRELHEFIRLLKYFNL